MDESFPAAEQTGAAGADATDGGQVGVMEDGQLHGQSPPDAERSHRKENEKITHDGEICTFWKQLMLNMFNYDFWVMEKLLDLRSLKERRLKLWNELCGVMRRFPWRLEASAQWRWGCQTALYHHPITCSGLWLWRFLHVTNNQTADRPDLTESNAPFSVVRTLSYCGPTLFFNIICLWFAGAANIYWQEVKLVRLPGLCLQGCCVRSRGCSQGSLRFLLSQSLIFII